jgi:hypothetical protein
MPFVEDTVRHHCASYMDMLQSIGPAFPHREAMGL